MLLPLYPLLQDEHDKVFYKSTSALSHKVTGLYGYMNYSISVKAENDAGFSPSSSPVQAQTLIRGKLSL